MVSTTELTILHVFQFESQTFFSRFPYSFELMCVLPESQTQYTHNI